MILSIETSTKVCSVALHNEGKLIGVSTLQIQNSHSSVLFPMIENLLINAQIDKSELLAIAIAKGPGSYTGLRIGAVAAKGLCYALGLPLISINTLKALSQSFIEKNTYLKDVLLVPLLDARRKEVFTAIFDECQNEVKSTHAKVLEEGDFFDLAEEKNIYIFGNASEKTEEIIGVHPKINFIHGMITTSESMGKLAFEKYKEKKFEDVAYFEPFYLKEFLFKKSKKNPLLT